MRSIKESIIGRKHSTGGISHYTWILTFPFRSADDEKCRPLWDKYFTGTNVFRNTDYCVVFDGDEIMDISGIQFSNIGSSPENTRLFRTKLSPREALRFCKKSYSPNALIQNPDYEQMTPEMFNQILTSISL